MRTLKQKLVLGGPRGARSSEPFLAKGLHFCFFDGQFLLKGSHFWRYFWRRGAISGPAQRTISGEGAAFVFLMVNFCLRGCIFGVISGEGVRFPARSSEPPTKHRWITIDGGIRSGAALTDQKPSPKMRSKMQPLRQKIQPCNPQMRLGLASRTEANAPLSFSTLFSMKG